MLIFEYLKNTLMTIKYSGQQNSKCKCKMCIVCILLESKSILNKLCAPRFSLQLQLSMHLILHYSKFEVYTVYNIINFMKTHWMQFLGRKQKFIFGKLFNLTSNVIIKSFSITKMRVCLRTHN